MKEENFILHDRWKDKKDRTRVVVMSVHWVKNKDGKWEQVYKELLWKKIKIRKSLDEVCHYLEMEIPFSERDKIDKHEKIEVRVYNPNISAEEDNFHCRLITTVLVDCITEYYSAGKQSLNIIGRSPARDIIDSAWSDGPFDELTLEEIAKQIAKPFGIRIDRASIGSPATENIFRFSWSHESPWTKLINECDNQGFIFTSSEDGSLYLWKVASSTRHEGKDNEKFGKKTFFRLSARQGEANNIREIEMVRDGSQQFYEYYVRGNFKESRITDDDCKSKRMHHIHISDFWINQVNIERRALTEKCRRQGNKVIVTISGWGLTDDKLRGLGNTKGEEIFWNPNFLVPVDFPVLNYEKDLLISAVEYNAGMDGMTCTITLTDREVYL